MDMLFIIPIIIISPRDSECNNSNVYFILMQLYSFLFSFHFNTLLNCKSLIKQRGGNLFLKRSPVGSEDLSSPANCFQQWLEPDAEGLQLSDKCIHRKGQST